MSLILLVSCKSEYKFILNTPQKIQSNQELTISISEKNNKPIDSVQFSIGSKKIESNGTTSTLNINDFKLGKHTITAIVFYQNKTEKVSKTVYFTADTAPEIYTYKIINTYPHDKNAFTQGLEYYKGYLYEGTGRRGQSYIRKVELETGKVLQQKNLDVTYFGEGITVFNGKIYQLTWKNKVGFIYNAATLVQEKTFDYFSDIEGWGLTHNEKHLIMSDGTNKIYFLNPESQKMERFINVYSDTNAITELNELEWIDGKIWANIYLKDVIVIINPENGAVESAIDFSELKTKNKKALTEGDEVLNGIAYNPSTKTVFITGKNWDKMFEIKLK